MTSFRVAMCVLTASPSALHTVKHLTLQFLEKSCAKLLHCVIFTVTALICRLLGIVLVSGIVSTQAQLSQVCLS